MATIRTLRYTLRRRGYAQTRASTPLTRTAMTADPEPSILPAASAPTAWTAVLGRHRTATPLRTASLRTATIRTRRTSTTRHHHRLRRRIRPRPRAMAAPSLTSSAPASSSPMPTQEDHLTLTLGKTVAGADGRKTSKSLGCTTTAVVNWGLGVKCNIAALLVASAHVVPTRMDAAIRRTTTIRTIRIIRTRTTTIRTIRIIRTPLVRTPTPRAALATITC